MTKARTNADNVAGDISGVTAGTGLSGGGTSGTVTISADTAVVATTNNTLTMSGKTLTAPRFASAGEIDDANGNELIKFPATVASAINEITVTNATTSGTPSISATGDDTNISLNLVPKGTGTVQAGGVEVATTSGTQTLTNKTLSGATLTGTLTAGGGVGSNGQVLKSTGTGVQWASAGTTFTQRLSPNQNNDFYSFATNGSNIYVGVGSAGILFSSTDSGITWTSRTSGFGSNNINKVAFGNGLFVAVGANGTITTSSDGITWTARTSNMSTNEIRDVVYANSIWVAVGLGGGATNTGGIIYSTDGFTWTRKSQTPTIGAAYHCVVWNGTNWIVGADPSTNNYLYATTPSGTWTADVGGVAQNIYFLAYDGTRTIFAHAGDVWRYSTSTTLASSVALTATFQPSGIGYTMYRNMYYFNSAFHMARIFYQTISTTPSLNNYSFTNLSMPIALPSSAPKNGSGAFTSPYSGILVTAAGIVIGGYGAEIYTSF